MSHRVLRLAVDLPDLEPVQAELLCDLFQSLTDQIWAAYEREIFDLEAQRFHACDEPDADSDSEPPPLGANPSSDPDDDPDF